MAVSVIVSRDLDLIEAVEVSAAAVGVQVDVATTPADVVAHWGSARLMLIGGDAAPEMAALGLPSRGGVFLIGGNAATLADWSLALRAVVLVLPTDSAELAGVLGADAESAVCESFWFFGASGGLGVSTLVAGLGHLIGRRSPVAVVERQGNGGGVDLLFGAEGAAGWRWPELAGAAGQLGDLTDLVPTVGRVSLVSMGREPSSVSPAAEHAVMTSLARSTPTLLIDGGASRPTAVRVRPVLVVGGDVRSISAARVALSAGNIQDAQLVVRQGVGRRIAPQLVAETLGVPLLGALPNDNRMPRLAEAGKPPCSVGGRFTRAASGILRGLANV